MAFLWLSIPATVCSTTASVPQLVNSRAAISRKTIAIRGAGCVLWSVYGAVRGEYVLCVCSAIAGCVEITLYVKTFLCRRAPADTAPSPARGAAGPSFDDTGHVAQLPRSDSASTVRSLTLCLECVPTPPPDS